MNLRHHFRQCAMLGALASSLLLSGCFFTAGKFSSELTLHRGGAFTFAYDGEVSMMALNQMMKSGKQEFAPSCIDEDSYEERDCTRAEVEEQRETWERKQAEDEREKQQFAQMFGGVDMSDPDSGKAVAAVLGKQAGWQSVELIGEGLLKVSYSVSGNLTHGFQFPAVEQMQGIMPFVAVFPRNDGNVRVDAPGFGGADGMGGMGAMGGMGMLAAMGAASSSAEGSAKPPVLPDGTFAIVTDGNIRANNTNEGPEELAGGMRRLEWKVDSSSQSAPMALINLN